MSQNEVNACRIRFKCAPMIEKVKDSSIEMYLNINVSIASKVVAKNTAVEHGNPSPNQEGSPLRDTGDIQILF
jgi:hypothetical protein